MTSVVTAVRHGPVERAFVMRAGEPVLARIPVAALKDFVTERGNPHNLKGISAAEVEAPAAFLKRGLHLVDTPGVGSVHAESTAVTRAFLPSADAALFITSGDAPLSYSEVAFLDTVRSYVRKVFFVVNKMDTVPPPESREVVRFVEAVLAEKLGIVRPPVFPLSARLALDARVSGAASELIASGLPALETALAGFLSRERRRVFLAAVLDRALRLAELGRFALELRGHRAAGGGARTALAHRLEGIEAARRGALDVAAARNIEWERWVLEPALATWVASTLDELRRDLPGPGAPGRVDGDTCAERLARWRRQALAEKSTAWECEHRTAIDAATQDLSDRLSAALRQAVADVGHAAAEALGCPPPAGVDARASWTPAPAPFEPGKAGVQEGPSRAAGGLPGPAGLGRRIACWLERRDLPNHARDAADRLRQRVRAHLGTCLNEWERASGKAMAREKERFGLTPGPAAAHAEGALPDEDGGRLERLVQRIVQVRDAILEGRGGDPRMETVGGAGTAATATTETRPALERAQTTRSRDWARSRTCPVCARVLDALFDFLSRFQYALATDRRTQATFRDTGGFCALHAWQLEELSSPRGLSAGYPTLLESTAETLRSLAARPPSEAGRAVLELVADNGSCAACQVRSAAEDDATSALCADLATGVGRTRHERSHGLCLRHLALVLPRMPAEAVPFLLRHQSRRCLEVAEGLGGYALKFDSHRQDLLSRDEDAAWRHAVVLVAGARRVF